MIDLLSYWCCDLTLEISFKANGSYYTLNKTEDKFSIYQHEEEIEYCRSRKHLLEKRYVTHKDRLVSLCLSALAVHQHETIKFYIGV